MTEGCVLESYAEGGLGIYHQSPQCCTDTMTEECVLESYAGARHLSPIAAMLHSMYEEQNTKRGLKKSATLDGGVQNTQGQKWNTRLTTDMSKTLDGGVQNIQGQKWNYSWTVMHEAPIMPYLWMGKSTMMQIEPSSFDMHM